MESTEEQSILLLLLGYGHTNQKRSKVVRGQQSCGFQLTPPLPWVPWVSCIPTHYLSSNGHKMNRLYVSRQDILEEF